MHRKGFSNPPFRTIVLSSRIGPRDRLNIESELRLHWSFVHVGKRPDHYRSRICLLFSDCGRVAAERKERRSGCGIRRSGQPDGVWPAGRGIGSFPGDDLVRNHFYAHVDHAFDFRGAANGTDVRPFRSKVIADEVAARDSGCAIRAADGSAKPGADTKVADSV
jgi:hypothetical protein